MTRAQFFAQCEVLTGPRLAPQRESLGDFTNFTGQTKGHDTKAGHRIGRGLQKGVDPTGLRLSAVARQKVGEIFLMNVEHVGFR
jgi:hypothetical protein